MTNIIMIILENLINSCTASFENKEDPSALWEYVKFKIREFTISYSKNIAIERRQKFSTLSSKLYETEKIYSNHPKKEHEKVIRL